MSDQPNVDPTATPAQPEQASVWEDFIDIFYAPSAVFERRASGQFWIPFLVVTLLSGVFFYFSMSVLQPAMDGDFARATAAAMKKNPALTPEMMAQGRAIQEKVAKYVAPIVIMVIILLVSLCQWLAGKIVGAKQTWVAALMVTSYAFVPRLLDAILTGVQGILLKPEDINGMTRLRLGPTHFMDPDSFSPVLIAVLSRVDIFTIWSTVLIAIGLSVTGKIPRSQAAVAAIMVWLLGVLPTLLPALTS